MTHNYFEDKIFDKTDYTKIPVVKGDYEGCIFINCNFSGADLTEINFIECKFNGCNLSMVHLIKTTLNDIEFKDCKMLGMQFEHCNKFSLSFGFDNCNLTHSSFYQTKIKNTVFKNCLLQEVDFTDGDCTNTIFENCDLINAKFDNTILEKANLRTSFNYSIDPERNRIKKAKFSSAGIAGLLDKYDIQID